jgi:hypothetical protein
MWLCDATTDYGIAIGSSSQARVCPPRYCVIMVSLSLDGQVNAPRGATREPGVFSIQWTIGAQVDQVNNHLGAMGGKERAGHKVLVLYLAHQRCSCACCIYLGQSVQCRCNASVGERARSRGRAGLLACWLLAAPARTVSADLYGRVHHRLMSVHGFHGHGTASACLRMDYCYAGAGCTSRHRTPALLQLRWVGNVPIAFFPTLLRHQFTGISPTYTSAIAQSSFMVNISTRERILTTVL